MYITYSGQQRAGIENHFIPGWDNYFAGERNNYLNDYLNNYFALLETK